MIDELKSLPKSPHDDAQDAAALAIPPMAGIIGAAAAILNPKLKDAHVEIPRKPDDMERRLTFKNPKVHIGQGNHKWGAELGKMYFVITWEE